MKKIIEPTKDWHRLIFPAFPTVLVTCEHGGIRDIVTVGCIHVFSFSPPVLGIGLAPQRYSYGLIDKSGKYGVNIATKELVDQALGCGSVSGREVNKFDKFHLTAFQGILVPLIAECPVNIECTVTAKINAGDHDWFLGKVEKIHIDEGFDKTEALLYWGGDFRAVGSLIKKRY